MGDKVNTEIHYVRYGLACLLASCALVRCAHVSSQRAAPEIPAEGFASLVNAASDAGEPDDATAQPFVVVHERGEHATLAAAVNGSALGSVTPQGYDTNCTYLSGPTCVYHRTFAIGQAPIDAFWTPWALPDGGPVVWDNAACCGAGPQSIYINDAGALVVAPQLLFDGGTFSCSNPTTGYSSFDGGNYELAALQAKTFNAHSFTWRVDGVIPANQINSAGQGTDNILWSWSTVDGGACQTPSWPIGHYSAGCYQNTTVIDELDWFEGYTPSNVILNSAFHVWALSGTGVMSGPSYNAVVDWSVTNLQRHVYVGQLVSGMSYTVTVDGAQVAQIDGGANVPSLPIFPFIYGGLSAEPDAGASMPVIQIYEMEIRQDAL